MNKKQNWEKEYSKYEYGMPTELEEKLEKLEKSINERKDGNEAAEYLNNEYKKLSEKNKKINEKLPKVKNIMEFRNGLNNEIEDVKNILELKKRDQQLEQIMENLQNEWENLQQELKGKEGKEREEVKQKIKENDAKRKINNKKFVENNNKIKAANSKFDKLSIEELKDFATQSSAKITECNIACNLLMQGRTWDDVEVALDKYDKKRFVAKGKQAEKMKQNIKSAKALNSKGEKSQNNKENLALLVQGRGQALLNKIKGLIKGIADRAKGKKFESNEKGLISKIRDRIKNVFNKNKDNEEHEQNEQQVNINTQTNENKFRDYLKFIAENGMDINPEVKKSMDRIIEAKREQAKKEGKPFDEEKVRKTAKVVAENTYKRKHQTKEQQDNEGIDR